MGIREALILTALGFVPATVFVVSRQRESILHLGAILSLYLVFGAGAGVLIGLVRPTLSKASGATFVGGVIGAIGFAALTCIPDADHPFPGVGVATISAALGMLTGGLLGWWTWRRSQRQRRT